MWSDCISSGGNKKKKGLHLGESDSDSKSGQYLSWLKLKKKCLNIKINTIKYPSANSWTRSSGKGGICTLHSSTQQPTFPLRSAGQRVLVFMFPCDPTVLHTAEEGSPSSSGQVGRPDRCFHLDLNPSCIEKKTDPETTPLIRLWFAPCWIRSTFVVPDALLDASTRRCWGSISEDESCSFTLWISLGWMKSSKLCPVSSNWKIKRHLLICFRLQSENSWLPAVQLTF